MRMYVKNLAIVVKTVCVCVSTAACVQAGDQQGWQLGAVRHLYQVQRNCRSHSGPPQETQHCLWYNHQWNISALTTVCTVRSIEFGTRQITIIVCV